MHGNAGKAFNTMKEFSWSFSRLKNFNTCAFRHEQVDILKKYKEDSAQLTEGNRVHAALANALTGKTALPPDLRLYQKWVDKIQGMPGELLVEQKFALTRSWEPTEYFSPHVWLRSIADVVRLDGPIGFTGDFKTGKMKHDADQLTIVAQCIFSFHPEVQKISASFIWLQDGAATKEIFTRETVANAWKNGLLQRVEAMETAARTNNYPKQPGGLCKKWCPVSECPHYQIGSF